MGWKGRVGSLGILVAGAFLAGQAAEPAPHIDWSDLPSALLEKAPDLRTGYLVVPERRSAGPGTHEIRLPFVIMRSRSATPAADPVLFTAGGPGGGTLTWARGRARNPLLEDRDVILFEQRGTGGAEPALAFPALMEVFRSGWGSRLNGEPDPEKVRKAMRTEVQRLAGAGVDPAGYTTAESAADIQDLRRLLGLESWNLYGASYSTRLMLEVLRDHPEGVRSVILDSVLPTEARWDEQAPGNIFTVLERVLAAGLKDDRLRDVCRGLRPRILRLVANADRRPLTIHLEGRGTGAPLTLRLDGAGVMKCIYAGLETAGTIRRLPAQLDAACRGEVAALAPLAEMYLTSVQGFAWGMRLSVWCNEELPFEKLDRILHPPDLPRELRGWHEAAVPLEALDAWPQGRPGAREKEPVGSPVKALILAGEFDPDTPVAWARQVAERFPNGFLVVFPGMSHVPSFTHPEAGPLMRAFLADPGRRPAVERIQDVPGFLLTLR